MVPIFDKRGEVYGVIDIDSTEVGTFDAVDRQYLEELARLVAESLAR